MRFFICDASGCKAEAVFNPHPRPMIPAPPPCCQPRARAPSPAPVLPAPPLPPAPMLPAPPPCCQPPPMLPAPPPCCQPRPHAASPAPMLPAPGPLQLHGGQTAAPREELQSTPRSLIDRS
ncbi:unnamed protein product [Arctogadus glacialis]